MPAPARHRGSKPRLRAPHAHALGSSSPAQAWPPAAAFPSRLHPQMAPGACSLPELLAQREELAAEQRRLRTLKRRLQDRARVRCRRTVASTTREAAATELAALAPPEEREAAVHEFRERSGLPPASDGRAAPPPVARASPAPPAPDTGASPAPPMAAEPGDERPARLARRFWCESRLRKWVRGVNADAGLAPTTAQVWTVYRGLETGSPAAALEAPAAALGASRRATQWVRRWRRR